MSIANVGTPTYGKQWVPKRSEVQDSKQDAVEKEQWNGMVFNVLPEHMEWLDKCYIGEAHSPLQVESIQDRLLEDGVLSMKMIPLGGSLCLLQPMEGEDLYELVNDVSGYLGNWFVCISKWTYMEVAREHHAWIRFCGVSIHAWTQELFEMLLSCFGRFITMDDNIFTKRRLDVTRVLLRSSCRHRRSSTG